MTPAALQSFDKLRKRYPDMHFAEVFDGRGGCTARSACNHVSAVITYDGETVEFQRMASRLIVYRPDGEVDVNKTAALTAPTIVEDDGVKVVKLGNDPDTNRRETSLPD